MREYSERVAGTASPAVATRRGLQDSAAILTTEVMTLWYRAPEILLGSTRYTQSVDVWAVGTIAAEMVRGKPLFPGGSTMNTIERILEYTGRPSAEAIKSTRSPFAETMINEGLPASAGSSPRVSLSTFCKGTGAPKSCWKNYSRRSNMVKKHYRILL